MSFDTLQDIKEQVRLRLDIVTLVEKYVNLKPAGSNYKGICPFHKDSKPSLTVSPSKELFRCFACGTGGDIFSFIMEIEGCTFVEALKIAANEVGIEVKLKAQTENYQASGYTREHLYSANQFAMNYYYTSMKNSKTAIEYFKNRQLDGEIVRDFRLGYSPDIYDGMVKEGEINGYPTPLLVEAGIFGLSQKGGTPYERFRGRVIFPIFDIAGRPIAFGGRIIDPDAPKSSAKYVNTSETPLYLKNRVLYGLYQARAEIRDQKSAIIVEGYMDTLALVQGGIKNVVAPCGTALTPEHGQLLKRFTDKVYLIFDGDSAGLSAAKRAVENLFPLNIDIRVVILPDGEDPDSLINSEGKENFLKRVADAQNVISFYSYILSQSYDVDSPQGNSKAVNRFAELISTIQDEFVRSSYMQKVSSIYNVNEAQLRNRVKSIVMNGKVAGVEDERQDESISNEINRLISTEEGSLLHLLISDENLFDEWKDIIYKELFCEPLFIKLYSYIKEHGLEFGKLFENSKFKNVTKIISMMQIVTPNIGESSKSSRVKHIFERLSYTLVERQKRDINHQMANTSNSVERMKLLVELSKLSKKRNNK